MDIAFVGLGRMGLPMAQNLLNAGYALTVFNRTPEKARTLTEKGARLAATPGRAAGCGVAVTMLSDDAALEETVSGPDGILAGLGEDGLHISMSTVSPALSARLAVMHQNAGQHFVAAPVIGRPDAAQAAALRILLAGEARARMRARPILEPLGRQIFDLGERCETANVVKLGINFVSAAMIEALSEAHGLMAHYGVDPAAFLDVVNATYQSPALGGYGALMVNRRFSPAAFKMTLGLKDLRLAAEAAREVSASLPLGELVCGQLGAQLAAGHGDLDWTALLLNHVE